MLIAGWCLFNEDDKYIDLYQTAKELKKAGVTHFRCKLWGGGTSLDRLFEGVQFDGVKFLQNINDNVLPAGCEVFTPQHIEACRNLDYLWIGARNSSNFWLLREFANWEKPLLIKRGFGMTTQEVYNLYLIATKYIGVENVYIVERGINTFDRTEIRWKPDFLGMVQLLEKKVPLIFDVSHSCAEPKFFKKMYESAKNLGVEHFMFEVYQNKNQTKTDTMQAINIQKFKEIIGV